MRVTRRWTAWIGQQVFDEPALNRVVAYRGGLAAREAELRAIEAELLTWAKAPPLATTVARLGAYRGIAALTGMTLAAEVVDWRPQLVGAGALEEEQTVAALADAGLRLGLGERECVRTIDSGSNAGIAAPRSLAL